MSFFVDNWTYFGPVAGFGAAYVPAAVRKAKALWAAVVKWANEP